MKRITTLSILAILALVVVACTPVPAAQPTPAPAATAVPAATAAPADAMAKDIVDTAVANGSFTTLVAAARPPGWSTRSRVPAPSPSLRPTDAAFAKLPAGTVDGLLKDPG